MSAVATNNTLTVRIHKAEDLKQGDLLGLSDPYVEVRIVSMHPTKEGVRKTKHINHTLCPTWDEEFVFHPVHPRDDILEVKVYDHNALSSNQLLGLTQIAVAACFVGKLDEWKELRKPSDKQTKGQGRIHLIIEYNGEGLISQPNQQQQQQQPTMFQQPTSPMQYIPPLTSTIPQQPTVFAPPDQQPPQQFQQPIQPIQQFQQPIQSIQQFQQPIQPIQQTFQQSPQQFQQPIQPIQQFQQPIQQTFQQPQQTFQQSPQQFQQPIQQFQQPQQDFGNQPAFKVSHAADNQLVDNRPECQYGMNCYRKNPMHFREMRHPPGHPLAQ